MATAKPELKDKSPTVAPTYMKLIVLGASSVGKTTLIRQFIHGNVLDPPGARLEDFHTREMVDDDGTVVRTEILDSTTDLEYLQVTRLTIQTGDAFVLVYAVDDKISYEKMCGIRDMIVKMKKKENKKVCIVVVGNKIDLDRSIWAVSKEFAEAVVTMDWGYSYIELTATDKDAVDGIFKEVLWRYRHPDAGSMVGLRRMTAPSDILNRFKRRLTLKRQKSFV